MSLLKAPASLPSTGQCPGALAQHLRTPNIAQVPSTPHFTGHPALPPVPGPCAFPQSPGPPCSSLCLLAVCTRVCGEPLSLQGHLLCPHFPDPSETGLAPTLRLHLPVCRLPLQYILLIRICISPTKSEFLEGRASPHWFQLNDPLAQQRPWNTTAISIIFKGIQRMSEVCLGVSEGEMLRPALAENDSLN